MSNDTLEEVGLPTPTESEVVKTAEPNTPTETAADGEVEKKQDEPAKTFTQAEVDAMVQKRLLKEQRKISRDFERKLTEQQQAKALVPPERESFRDDDEYLQAQIEHLAEKKAAEKLAERERAQESERRSESFLEKAEKASERYADFQSVVGNPALSINDSMAEFIAESDLGADVAYFLGKNPMKAAQIAQMSPVKAARELLLIETEIASKPKANPSKAPEPINPVGSRGKSTTSSLPSDDDDIDTWMRKERERQRKR
jgi:predicted phage tail protein